MVSDECCYLQVLQMTFVTRVFTSYHLQHIDLDELETIKKNFGSNKKDQLQ